MNTLCESYFEIQTELFEDQISNTILLMVTHKTNTILKFISVSRWLGHDNLELITAVANSTFLKRMEPVVFCFLSTARSLSL